MSFWRMAEFCAGRLISRQAMVALRDRVWSRLLKRASYVFGDGLLGFVFEHQGGEGEIDLDEHVGWFSEGAAADGKGHAFEIELHATGNILQLEIVSLKVADGFLERGANFGNRASRIVMRHADGDFRHVVFRFLRRC